MDPPTDLIPPRRKSKRSASFISGFFAVFREPETYRNLRPSNLNPRSKLMYFGPTWKHQNRKGKSQSRSDLSELRDSTTITLMQRFQDAALRLTPPNSPESKHQGFLFSKKKEPPEGFLTNSAIIIFFVLTVWAFCRSVTDQFRVKLTATFTYLHFICPFCFQRSDCLTFFFLLLILCKIPINVV